MIVDTGVPSRVVYTVYAGLEDSRIRGYSGECTNGKSGKPCSPHFTINLSVISERKKKVKTASITEFLAQCVIL